jgi:glycosyltransferase involved in cell wall biosynthesis
VIDDDSMYSDEYQEIITHFNHHFTIQYIKMEKNSGPGPCRNVVFDKGTAPWIIFIDDDDIFINNPIRNFNTQDSSINLIKTIVTDG